MPDGLPVFSRRGREILSLLHVPERIIRPQQACTGRHGACLRLEACQRWMVSQPARPHWPQAHGVRDPALWRHEVATVNVIGWMVAAVGLLLLVLVAIGLIAIAFPPRPNE